jgi:ubiquinone/menaquinone biosynthesis C-methylase UbiE
MTSTPKTANGSHALWIKTADEILGTSPREYLLDLCCGGCAVTRHLGFEFHRGIDLIDNPERPSNVVFSKLDALEYLLTVTRRLGFDLAVISDGLEHLPDEKATRLLDEMVRVARRSIIFVPDDSLVTPASHDHHVHKSHWPASKWAQLGYNYREFPTWHAHAGAVFAWRDAP